VYDGMDRCDCICSFCAEDECHSATCDICSNSGANRGMKRDKCEYYKEQDEEYEWRQKAKLRIFLLMKKVKYLNKKERNEYTRFDIMEFDDE
jgi:hypothetical protein